MRQIGMRPPDNSAIEPIATIERAAGVSRAAFVLMLSCALLVCWREETDRNDFREFSPRNGEEAQPRFPLQLRRVFMFRAGSLAAPSRIESPARPV
jgi:hypothetical protein